MKPLTLPRVAAAIAALTAAGCAGEPGAPPESSDTLQPASRSEVEAYLQQKVASLSPAYPGVTLSNFRYSENADFICATLIAPGEAPLLFASVDDTPETVERAVSLPNLHHANEWRNPRTAEQQAAVRGMCERAGLLPD